MHEDDAKKVAGGLLSIGLSAAVPLRIAILKQKGGPAQSDIEEARAFSQTLGEKGDVLMFKGKKKGEAGDLFNRLAQALAVLSFCPGGVRCFGEHFKARPEDP